MANWKTGSSTIGNDALRVTKTNNVAVPLANVNTRASADWFNDADESFEDLSAIAGAREAVLSWRIGDGVDNTGLFCSATIAVGGAHRANAPSNGNSLVVGHTTGTNVGMTIVGAAAGIQRLYFGNASDNDEAQIFYQPSIDTMALCVGADTSNYFHVRDGGTAATNYIACNTSNTMKCGTDALRWSEVHGTTGSFQSLSGTRHIRVTEHFCNTATTAKFYLPNGSSQNESTVADNIGLPMVMPFNGRLRKVIAWCSIDAGSTAVGLERINEAEIERVVQGSFNSGSATTWTFASSASHYSTGDRVAVFMDPTIAPGNLWLTCVWEDHID